MKFIENYKTVETKSINQSFQNKTFSEQNLKFSEQNFKKVILKTLIIFNIKNKNHIKITLLA